MLEGNQSELIGRRRPLISADVTYQVANLLEPSVIQDRSFVSGKFDRHDDVARARKIFPFGRYRGTSVPLGLLNHSRSPKRARSSSHPLDVAADRPSLLATVAMKGQVYGGAYSDRPPRNDQECKVLQFVGESGSEYEVTALTKMWLPKASLDPKLVRKHRAEQRAAARI
jgi:hypothetical protein